MGKDGYVSFIEVARQRDVLAAMEGKNAGFVGFINFVEIHKPLRNSRLSCGERTRTADLQVMSLASYHCSTPRLVRAAPRC
jgi:hypothetical protein